MSLKKAVIIIFIILMVDQLSKFYIKMNFPLTAFGHNAIVDWGFFKLLFVENKGMAWGTKLSDIFPFISDRTAKTVLTSFRLIAIIAIGYWLRDAIRKSAPRILIICIALIFAGALGNIIDSVFYGVIFSNSYGQVATLFPPEGGYETLFHGHVVDMLQFPLATWTWPDWVPWVGGSEYTFFEPVFNIADSSISIGVMLLLLFNKKAFPARPMKEHYSEDAWRV